MKRSRNGALTLIEMLMVAAIITLLVSVLFPQMVGLHERARRGACSANLRRIGEALANYASEYRSVLPYRGPHSGKEAAEYLATYGEACQGASASNYPRQRIDSSPGSGAYSQGLGLIYKRQHIDRLSVLLCPSNPFYNQSQGKAEAGTLDESQYFYLAWDGALGSAGENPANVKERRRGVEISTRAIAADQGIGQNVGEDAGSYQGGWRERQHRNEGHNVLYLGGNVLWLPIEQTYPGDPATHPEVFNMTFTYIDQ